MDIAGLVKGASKGEGLGNKFLANIRETDAIVHVVRCFDDENVIHVEGSTDPRRDIDIINMELVMADLEMVQRRVEKATQAMKGDKKFQHEVDVFTTLQKHLDGGNLARTFSCDEDDAALIATSDLLTLKPVIYAANTDEAGFTDLEHNQYYQQVKAIADAGGQPGAAHLRQDGAGHRRAGGRGEADVSGGAGSGGVRPGPAHQKIRLVLYSVALTASRSDTPILTQARCPCGLGPGAASPRPGTRMELS